jgi:hypothetical protein
MKFNYFHLSRRFYEDEYRENEDQFNNRYYSRKFHNVKMLTLTLSIIFVVNGLLFLVHFTRCSIYAFVFSFYNQSISDISYCQKSDINNNYYLFFGDLLVNLVLFCEILIFVFLLFRVMRYPVKNDKFHLRLEFIVILFLWFIFNHICLGIFYLSNSHFSLESLYLINTTRNGLMVLVYFSISLVRRNITSEQFKHIIEDFEIFMTTHVCFTFFKDYLKNNKFEDFKFLSFWIDCKIFKKEADLMMSSDPRPSVDRKGSQCSSPEDENAESLLTPEHIELLREWEQNFNNIKEIAKSIYSEYFENNNNNQQSISPSRSSCISVDFPTQIKERVEEKAKLNFNVEDLNTVFDEAFSEVSQRLTNQFYVFIRNSEEIEKLQKIIFFMEFYEIKRLSNVSIK